MRRARPGLTPLDPMPDTDAPSRSLIIAAPGETAQLPVPVAGGTGRNGETWFGRVLRLFGWKAGSARKKLEVVLEDGKTGDTGFSPQERTMLKNILGLRERRVEDVMVPRADIVAVQQDISLGELIKVFEGAGHSRLVVYNDTLDDPVGMVHIRDLIAYMAERATVKPEAAGREDPLPANLDLRAVDLSVPLSSTKIVRALLFVPPSMPVIDLFAKMQATRIHLALVIDEYGGTDGVVSIEDIVEQVVGEIDDEHDEEEAPSMVRQPDGSFLAAARASLEDVVAALGEEFDVGDAADEVDTLGGYLFTKIGRVPTRGELVPGPGNFEIEIVDADPRRVKRLRIYRKKAPPAGTDRDGKRRPARSEAIHPPQAADAVSSAADAKVGEPSSPGASH
jgi:CBS domain containing-hemolysin-like protein